VKIAHAQSVLPLEVIAEYLNSGSNVLMCRYDLQKAYDSCDPTKKPNFRVPFVTVSAVVLFVGKWC